MRFVVTTLAALVMLSGGALALLAPAPMPDSGDTRGDTGETDPHTGDSMDSDSGDTGDTGDSTDTEAGDTQDSPEGDTSQDSVPEEDTHVYVGAAELAGEAGGCGCATGSVPGSSLAILALLALGARRRS